MDEHVATLPVPRPSATEPGFVHAVSRVDRCIETYVERCRKKIPSFVERHFSLEQTWRLQKPTLWLDLLVAPLNSAWALPYIAVLKVADALERVGYLRPAQWVKRLPQGIKTGYQVEIERLIAGELLEWDRERAPAPLPQGFLKEFDADPALRVLTVSLERAASERKPARTPADLLRQFSAGRALVSDVAGTVLTLFASWLTLGNTSMSLRGIAYGVAQRSAHDRAASRFFLGKKLGSHFYNVFPPKVQESSVWLILAFLVVGLTVGAMACTILSDPVRKMLGFHRNRLEVLLDELEKDLIVLTHKTIALSMRASATAPAQLQTAPVRSVPDVANP